MVLETVAEHLSRVIEQIEAGEELQKSNNQLSITLDSIGDGVIVTDTDGKITRLNPRAEKLTGWAAEEALGRALDEVFHIVNAKTGEPVPNPVYHVIITGKTQALANDTILVARDGTEHHIADSAAPIRDHEDKMFGVIMVFSDVTERKKAEYKLRYLSYHDSLTGLYNRVYLEKEMERLDTERQLPIGMIMADLNELKITNDTLGHLVGDEMLRQTAEILKSSCRGEDIISRWGGDEFVIFLPQTTKEDVKAICHRIDERCKVSFVKDIPLSLALGYAIKNNIEKDLAEILIEAEENMYIDKLADR
jgi:diguanylate cyclase